MRDQYAGDISDYLKFSLLRSIVPPEMKLGVAWYYISGHDQRPDGRHLEYLDEKKWRALDPALYDALSTIRLNRSIVALQALPIWERQTLFHSASVSPRSTRMNWAIDMVKQLKSVDVVFMDPDNGLSKDGVMSRKSATLDEIKLLSASNRCLILIRFPSRIGTHIEQLKQYHNNLAAFSPVTMRTCLRVSNAAGGVSPRIRWFTVINANKLVQSRIKEFEKNLLLIDGTKVEVSGL